MAKANVHPNDRVTILATGQKGTVVVRLAGGASYEVKVDGGPSHTVGYDADEIKAIDSPDFHVQNHGTIFTFHPLTPSAVEHLAENYSGATFLGDAIATEHRYARDVANELQNSGFNLI